MLRKELREERERPSRFGRSRPRERGEERGRQLLVERSDARRDSVLAA
jgi:hypothetical protein